MQSQFSTPPSPSKRPPPPPLLNFLLLPPVEENAPLCATTRMPDPGGGGCFLWIPDVKREWNEVNTCLVMTSMHFSKMFARMGNVVVAHWPCNDAVERVSFNNGCRRSTTASWKESAIKRTVNEWTCKREEYIYMYRKGSSSISFEWNEGKDFFTRAEILELTNSLTLNDFA